MKRQLDLSVHITFLHCGELKKILQEFLTKHWLLIHLSIAVEFFHKLFLFNVLCFWLKYAIIIYKINFGVVFCFRLVFYAPFFRLLSCLDSNCPIQTPSCMWEHNWRAPTCPKSSVCGIIFEENSVKIVIHYWSGLIQPVALSKLVFIYRSCLAKHLSILLSTSEKKDFQKCINTEFLNYKFPVVFIRSTKNDILLWLSGSTLLAVHTGTGG